MKRLLPVLIVLPIAFAFSGGSAAAQCGEGVDSCEGGGGNLCASGCGVQAVQDIRVTYKYGFAMYVECGPPYLPACPPAKDVDVKATVLPSVAKILHISSTTITAGPTEARLGKDVDVPDPDENFGAKSHFYFVQLKPAVERAMKNIKVRTLEPTLSGSITRADGSKVNVKTRLGTTAFMGNCSGQSLRIKRRIVYGGHCIPR
jgi:hypothetical protein